MKSIFLKKMFQPFFLHFTLNSLKEKIKALPTPNNKESRYQRLFSKFSVSPREQQVIRLLLLGKSNKDIEQDLFISKHTVKNHIYNIYRKIGVKSRYQLMDLFNSTATVR